MDRRIFLLATALTLPLAGCVGTPPTRGAPSEAGIDSGTRPAPQPMEDGGGSPPGDVEGTVPPGLPDAETETGGSRPHDMDVADEDAASAPPSADITPDPSGPDVAVSDAAAPPDASPTTDTGAPPAPEPLDCTGLFGGVSGVSLCGSFPGSCGVVFRDRTGCTTVCNRAGLVCREVWEDVDGACAADRARPALTCDPPSGHQSDYCVCGVPEGCAPACGDRVCGPDGCGGLCGSCPGGTACQAGRCLTPPRRCEPGDCPAFPGAEGFGSRATGGRGGDVYRVTNLNDAGAGSLREGIRSATGPRTIVFAVGGTIRLASSLNLDRNDITIAGETAPGDGILLRDHRLRITGNNIILRHMRFRLGTGSGGENDAVWINAARDVILDHVSVSWGMDEGLSVTRAFQNVTIQNSVLAEDIRTDHQYGSLINSETPDGRLSLLRNAYLNQLGRTPRAASQNGQEFLLEMVNNVVYNWGNRGDWGTWATASSNERANWNMVGNYHIAGPSTANALRPWHVSTIVSCNASTARIHLQGNRIDSNRNGRLDGVEATHANTRTACTRVDTAHPVPAWARATVLSADQAVQHVLDRAGARFWQRDDVDARLIADLASFGTRGALRTSPTTWPTVAGGTAPSDRDGDGMPDWWEVRHGLDPDRASDRNGDADGDGYTNLENYLHYMVLPPAERPFRP